MIALLFTLLHLTLILTLFEPSEKEFCREGKEIEAISLVSQLASPGCRTHTTYTCIVINCNTGETLDFLFHVTRSIVKRNRVNM